VEDCNEDDRVQLRSDLTNVSFRECNLLPAPVHEGFLNVLEAIISQLGHRAVEFVPCFMGVVLTLLELYLFCDDEASRAVDVDDSNGSTERASRVRSLCFLRLAEMFEKYSNFDFSVYNGRMWNGIKRSVALLPQLTKSAEKAPSLLQMLVILSRHAHLRDLLCSNDGAIEAGFSCLSQSNSNAVVEAVLTLIENLVSNAVIKHIPTLLRHFELRLKVFGTTTSWKRELSILGRVCDVSKRKASSELRNSELDSLTLLLIPFLQFKTKGPDRDRLHILEILESTIPSISNSSAVSLFSTLSLLLGPFKAGPGYSSLSLRHKMASSLTTLSQQHLKETQSICQVVQHLCAMNIRIIEEMDAETVLSALKELRNHESEMSWLGLFKSTRCRQDLGPVIRTCFHLLFNDDGVVARAAFYTLKDLVDQARKIGEVLLDCPEEPSSSWEKFLEQSVVPLICAGVACKEAAARRFFILLTAEVSKVCKTAQSPHLLGDLSILISEAEPDLDFFLNVIHVQIHRRARGLSRLRKQLEADDIGDGKSMNLVKALVARRVISAGTYDLMKVVLEQSVQSHKETLRQQAALIYVRFLMNFPMSAEKIEKELKQLLVNIQYDGVEGRHSAISMVAAVIEKFPEPVVVKHSQLFFIALTMQLGNEESEKGRLAVSDCLASLLSRLPTDIIQSLLEYTCRWGESADLRLRRVSLSVLGIFVESCDIVSHRESNFNMVLSIAKEALVTMGDWELPYFALRLLEKAYSKSPNKGSLLLRLGNPHLIEAVIRCGGRQLIVAVAE
jgi:hypothetical protein